MVVKIYCDGLPVVPSKTWSCTVEGNGKKVTMERDFFFSQEKGYFYIGRLMINSERAVKVHYDSVYHDPEENLAKRIFQFNKQQFHSLCKELNSYEIKPLEEVAPGICKFVEFFCCCSSSIKKKLEELHFVWTEGVNINDLLDVVEKNLPPETTHPHSP